MRRIANHGKQVSLEEPESKIDLSVASSTLDELNEKALEILRREIINLMMASSSGLLSRDNAMSLTSYIKLLGELKEKENEELARLGDDHLRKLSDKS